MKGLKITIEIYAPSEKHYAGFHAGFMAEARIQIKGIDKRSKLHIQTESRVDAINVALRVFCEQLQTDKEVGRLIKTS